MKKIKLNTLSQQPFYFAHHEISIRLSCCIKGFRVFRDLISLQTVKHLHLIRVLKVCITFMVQKHVGVRFKDKNITT